MISVSKRKPPIIEIFPTLECNLCCKSCDRGKEGSVLEDFNDIKALYDNIKKDLPSQLFTFRISGGEPTIYPRINELIYFLRNAYPYSLIEFFTNAIALKKLTKRSLRSIIIIPSIYPSTEKIIKRDKNVANLLMSLGLSLEAGQRFHENMESYGKLRRNINPLAFCFIPTLLCGTKLVYPCCRAHRLGQMYSKNYGFNIQTSNLYRKLSGIIENTDLCVHCPRFYSDYAKIPLRPS